MGEKNGIDLNALRDVYAPKKKELPKSREDETLALKAEIMRLEEALEQPSSYEIFMALGPQEKLSQVTEANRHVSAEHQYDSVEEFAETLKPRGIDLRKLRLANAQAKLQELEGKE